MKKIVIMLLALSLLGGATAQTAKCGIDTKALMGEEVAAGATAADDHAQFLITHSCHLRFEGRFVRIRRRPGRRGVP